MSKQKKRDVHGVGVPLRPNIGDQQIDRLSGLVVVRLAPDASNVAQDANEETLIAHAKAHDLIGLGSVLERFGNPESHRLVRVLEPEAIIEMEREAAQTEFPPLNSLTQYWRVDFREHSRADMRSFIQELLEAPEVDSAWEDQTPTLPAVTPTDDPYNVDQNYQDAAPTGIDARWMWTQPDGEGAGIAVCDVEGGWQVTHEDLAGKAPTLIYGVQYPAWVDHGTAVLGEIAAIDNTSGVVGSAPAVNNISLSSIWDSATTTNSTDAMMAAVAALNAGDIMLIELQIGLRPMETVDDLLDVIRLASARGVIVVEAAGNGNVDLDAWTTSGGQNRLNRSSADFVDSGAIMIGAASSTVPHERMSFSNYGSRIDCYAWGENVTSTGYGDFDNGGGDPDKMYTDTFNGTSSASPIIVSAAALVQSKYKALTGTLLSPGQMRDLLSDPATGTPQGTTVAGNIGVMPNLAAIVPNLGLVPDIYVRDAVGDSGAVPWSGSISASPDVIVRPSSVANPQLAYGEGSGTENSITLGYEVESGQHNYIYVRVRNRGGTDAANVTATVYWADASTLVTPSSWNLIGSVTLPNVPVGDVLTVSPELVWDKADIPATGHYCFVATLDHANDSEPPTPGAFDWNAFRDMVRAHNNVTWRNFNVVNDLPDTPSSTATFPFKLTGAEDRARQFGFQVERRLPNDAQLALEGPYGLLLALRGNNPWEIEGGRNDEKARLLLPAIPRISLSRARITRAAKWPCAFVIQAGEQKVQFGHGVGITQHFAGQEIGRINWQFAPEACLCAEKVQPQAKA